MEKRDWLLPGGFGKHSKDQKKENSGSTCAMWNKLLTKEQAPCHWRLGRENLSTGRTLESSNPASHPKLGSPLPGSSQMASGLRPLPGGHQRELQTSAGKTWSLKSPYRPLHSPEDKQTQKLRPSIPSTHQAWQKLPESCSCYSNGAHLPVYCRCAGAGAGRPAETKRKQCLLQAVSKGEQTSLPVPISAGNYPSRRPVRERCRRLVCSLTQENHLCSGTRVSTDAGKCRCLSCHPGPGQGGSWGPGRSW